MYWVDFVHSHYSVYFCRCWGRRLLEVPDSAVFIALEMYSRQVRISMRVKCSNLMTRICVTTVFYSVLILLPHSLFSQDVTVKFHARTAEDSLSWIGETGTTPGTFAADYNIDPATIDSDFTIPSCGMTTGKPPQTLLPKRMAQFGQIWTRPGTISMRWNRLEVSFGAIV